MRRRHVTATLVLLGFVALGWEIGGADRLGRGSVETREAARLRLHFAEVEREMLARDISDLSPAQRAARSEQISRLREYATAGSFPRNTFHPGQRVPYFRDADGTLCAMAFLIAASGRGDLVDRIARSRNYARIPELVDEPGLAAWLQDHGLTVAEAARIQPSYDGDSPCCVIGDPPKPVPSRSYLMASAGANTLAGLSVVWNARALEQIGSRGWKGVLGLGAGALNMTMGIVKLGERGGENHGIGAWNLAVGATAAILGGRALWGRPRSATNASSRLRVVPVTAAGSAPSVGFQGSFRF